MAGHVVVLEPYGIAGTGGRPRLPAQAQRNRWRGRPRGLSRNGRIRRSDDGRICPDPVPIRWQSLDAARARAALCRNCRLDPSADFSPKVGEPKAEGFASRP